MLYVIMIYNTNIFRFYKNYKVALKYIQGEILSIIVYI